MIDIKHVLKKHKKWLEDKGGAKANLSYADLRCADLKGADLKGADLKGADLRCADLSYADLKGADLKGADLRCADLAGANLTSADLTSANLTSVDSNLTSANLAGANLTSADLSHADLNDANLWRTIFCKTILIGTCLDPDNKLNNKCGEFEIVDDYIIGYRTEKAGHIDKYRIGRYYSADIFSTSETECHPGLYICPSLDALKQYINRYNLSGSMIKVQTNEVHRAGSKYRCRWFRVLEKIVL